MACDEREQRQVLALQAIMHSFGTEAGEDCVNLFVEHHLAELAESYWKELLGTNTPDAKAVLGLLRLRAAWGKDNLEYFDFTLPGKVTQYVISVRFDREGVIEEIAMES